MASLQRAMFEDKLKKQMNPRLRPSRDELIERGVIAGDVFDRIYKLSNAEAVAVLASLTSKNRGWESEGEDLFLISHAQTLLMSFFYFIFNINSNQIVEYTLNQHDEDAIDDIEEMLEEKLLRRPDIKVLKEKGIIKQRGADPKLLATRNLSKKVSSYLFWPLQFYIFILYLLSINIVSHYSSFVIFYYKFFLYKIFFSLA